MRALESRRVKLSHQLASVNSTHSLAPLPPPSTGAPPADDKSLLNSLFARNAQSDLKSLEKLHRLAGITLFIPNNPNEGSISQDGKPDEYLGIRFETMQDGPSLPKKLVLRVGKFELPHYVILRRSFEEGNEYVVHRHTIPSFIPLVALGEEHLSRGIGGLERFALELHRHLILLSNRTTIVARLRTLEGVEEVKADEAMRLVEVGTQEWTAKIMLLDKGERCVVVNHEGERLQDVEKMILSEGRKGLVERILEAL